MVHDHGAQTPYPGLEFSCKDSKAKKIQSLTSKCLPNSDISPLKFEIHNGWNGVALNFAFKMTTCC